MNIGIPSVEARPNTNARTVGPVVTETASIAYDGTLLPVGNISYEIKLKEIL